MQVFVFVSRLPFTALYSFHIFKVSVSSTLPYHIFARVYARLFFLKIFFLFLWTPHNIS